MRSSDWSSDVCSSDLGRDFTSVHAVPEEIEGARALRWSAHLLRDKKHPVIVSAMTVVPTSAGRAGPGRPPVLISIIRLDAERLAALGKAGEIRSEERRDGKAVVSTCRYGWSP